MFAGHAAEAVTGELELHQSLLGDPGISRENDGARRAGPTNLAYTSYLLATVRGGSCAEGVGAVRPGY